MSLSYTTASRIDRLFVGDDHLPIKHSVIVVVVPEALFDDYPHAHDMGANCHFRVAATEGGDKVRDIRGYEDTYLLSFVVHLDPPAEAGKRRIIGYDVNTGYFDTPPPDFKLVAGDTETGEWDIAVCFSRTCLPTKVCSAEWNAVGGGGVVIESTIKPLDLVPYDDTNPDSPYMMARVIHKDASQAIIGIFWEW